MRLIIATFPTLICNDVSICHFDVFEFSHSHNGQVRSHAHITPMSCKASFDMYVMKYSKYVRGRLVCYFTPVNTERLLLQVGFLDI